MSERKKYIERAFNPDRHGLINYVRKCYRTPMYKEVEPGEEISQDKDPLDIEFGIWRTQLKFLNDIGRIKYNLDEDDLPEILDKVYKEDEQSIDVRVDLMDKEKWDLPDIWTRYGRLDRFCILKPEKIEDFGDLRKWEMYMVFSSHQDQIIEYDVAEGFGQFNHIMAWYALWRKWPTQYVVWEWATLLWDKFETTAMFLDYGHSGKYQQWWKWAEEDIEWLPRTFDPDKLSGPDYSCPWEGRLIGGAGTSYVPKLKRQRLLENENE